jgi:hypothetical protein
MAELSSFWHTGRAAGIEEHRPVRRLDLHRDWRRGGLGHQVLKPPCVRVRGDVLAVAFPFLPGQGEQELQHRRKVLFDVGDYHVLERRARPHFLHNGIEAAHHQHGLRTRVAKLMLNFARRIEGIKWNHDSASFQGAIVAHHELRAIGQIDGHAVAPAHTQLLQQGSKAIHQCLKLRIAEPSIHKNGCCGRRIPART